MRCPECGEENRQDAVMCGLCKGLFVPPARPSQVVSVLGRPSQAVPVLGGDDERSGGVPMYVSDPQTSRPVPVYVPDRQTSLAGALGARRPSRAVPVLGARATQSVPWL